MDEDALGEMTRDQLMYELGEARAELARHHRDLEKIRKAVDEAMAFTTAFTSMTVQRHRDALLQIRTIVG